MGRPADDEEFGIRPLVQPAIGPRVSYSPPQEINMGCDQGVNGIPHRMRCAGWTFGMLQHLLQHLAKLGALRRIGSSGEKG